MSRWTNVVLSVMAIVICGIGYAHADYNLNENSLHNGTGQTATDLEKWATGDLRVTRWTSSHFTKFSYAYTAGTNETKFRWYNGSVPDSTSISCCVWADKAIVQKYLPRWSYASGPSVVAGPALSFATMQVAPDTFTVSLGNFAQDGGPITLPILRIAALGRQYHLEQLVDDSLTAVEWEVTLTNVHIGLHDSLAVEGFAMPPGGSIVFSTQVYLDSDPSNVVEYVGQYIAHPAPTLTQWGLIALLALLLASGITVIIRRRRVVVQ